MAHADIKSWRERAAHVRKLADLALDPTTREALLDLARTWEETANKAQTANSNAPAIADAPRRE